VISGTVNHQAHVSCLGKGIWSHKHIKGWAGKWILEFGTTDWLDMFHQAHYEEKKIAKPSGLGLTKGGCTFLSKNLKPLQNIKLRRF
jgi:hypothetical protein